ncbi:MAG: hypothetical protein LIO77_08375 [Rikenellaceae bacterium]|nr:hypothetical protein [Rikenellaceae bacterium]
MENQNSTPQPEAVNTTVIIQEKKGNGVGTAGFVLALLGLIFCWVPVLGWILWLLGLILSFVGVFKTPRGLSIAGLIISCISIIITLAVLGAIIGSAAAF